MIGHPTSYWYSTARRPLPIYPGKWKPLPDGKTLEELRLELFGQAPPVPWVRPPETVYDAGPPDARLTPQPRDLLRAMQDGAVLRERVFKWSSWTLTLAGEEPKKLSSRSVDRLRELAFIARDGVPPEPLGWYDFEWMITDAGKAWIAANIADR